MNGSSVMKSSPEGKALIPFVIKGKTQAIKGRKSKAALEAEKSLKGPLTGKPIVPAGSTTAHHVEGFYREKADCLDNQIFEKRDFILTEKPLDKSNSQSDLETSSSGVSSILSSTSNSQNDSSILHSSTGDVSANFSIADSKNATFSIVNDSTAATAIKLEISEPSLVNHQQLKKPKALRKERKSKASKLAEMNVSNTTTDSNEYSNNTSNEDGSLTLTASIPATNKGELVPPQTVPTKRGRKSNVAKLLELASSVKQEPTRQPEATNNEDKRIALKRLSSDTATTLVENMDVKRRKSEEISNNLNFKLIDQQKQMRNTELEDKLIEITNTKEKLEKECWTIKQACASHQNLSIRKDNEIGSLKDQVTRLSQINSRKQAEISTMKVNEERVILDNNKLQKEMKRVKEMTTEEGKHFQSVKSSLNAVMSQNFALFEKVLGNKSALKTETDICDAIALIFGDFVHTKINEQFEVKKLKKTLGDLLENLAQKDNQIEVLKIGHFKREDQISKLLKREQAHLKQISGMNKSSKKNQTQLTKLQATINTFQQKVVDYKKEISVLKMSSMTKVPTATKVNVEFGDEVVKSLTAKLVQQEAERMKQTDDHISSLAAFKSEVSLTYLSF